MNGEIVVEFESTGHLVILVCLSLGFVITFGAIIYHRYYLKDRISQAKYVAIAKFFFQVTDLFTDLVFNMILYLSQRLLTLTYTSQSH